MTFYASTSPYYATEINAGYLDFLNFRSIPSMKDDLEFEITSKYENRPDLLAFDLYNDEKLWWVFAVRNKNTIKDPIFDMKPGSIIFLPKLSTIKASIGI
jgi:hypothetical protein